MAPIFHIKSWEILCSIVHLLSIFQGLYIKLICFSLINKHDIQIKIPQSSGYLQRHTSYLVHSRDRIRQSRTRFWHLIKILNIRCYIESMHSNIPKWGSNDQFWVLFRGMPPPLTMCHLMIWSQICILKMMSLLPLNGAWHFPLLKGVIYPHAILKVWWSYNVWARYVLEMESSARSTIGWTENTISLYSTLWIDNSEHNI